MKEIEVLRAEYRFDKPPIQRYFAWLGGFVQEISAIRSRTNCQCRTSSETVSGSR